MTTSPAAAPRTHHGTVQAASQTASPHASPSAKGALQRWLSPKAVACHVTVLILVPAFLTAAWWQAQRAVGGNTLSYLYVVEWPAFALVAMWAWWQIVHLPPRAVDETGGMADCSWLRWDPASESPPLKAYNRYLAELNRTGWMRRPPRLGPRPGELPSAGNPERALGPHASPAAPEAGEEPAP